MEPSVFNIVLQSNKQKYRATSTIAMTTNKQCIVVLLKIYATIKLQVLPSLLTPVSTRKKVARFIFETRLLVLLYPK
jgi:hypothetical protein